VFTVLAVIGIVKRASGAITCQNPRLHIHQWNWLVSMKLLT